MDLVWLTLALIGLTGIALLGRCGLRLRQRRRLAAARSGLGGGFCLALAGLAMAVGANLYTYQRLSHERPVARLHFTQLETQRFRVRIEPASGPSRRFELAGDQWQLDARVLKWRPLANLLGFDALYRLERLSGRYARAAAEAEAPRTVHALADRGPGLDVAALARRLPRWAGLADAAYGSATYLPMADGATYAVTLTQSGLVARPVNPAAKRATRHW